MTLNLDLQEDVAAILLAGGRNLEQAALGGVCRWGVRAHRLSDPQISASAECLPVGSRSNLEKSRRLARLLFGRFRA